MELDVLFYPEVGMDPLTYTLAFSRLAPVQCATWGHPVTTGLPAIDYFLSSVDLETEEADGHYTEKLVRLPRLGVCYERPPMPAPAERTSLGLPERGHLYACPQSPFKFHPDFDAILGGIPAPRPEGVLVLAGGAMARRGRSG
jgi:predicted O-linked N-acetylglucosamine transferase (SPINDLY family)